MYINDGTAFVTCILVGDSLCGKTSIIETIAKGQEPVKIIPTIVEIHVTEMAYKGKNNKIFLRDTTGIHEYEHLRRQFYEGADVAIAVFSIGERSSLENIEHFWYPEVCRYAPKIPILLIGNMKDLREQGKEASNIVQQAEGTALLKKIKAKKYLESSAMVNEDVESIFTNVLKTVHKKRGRYQ